MSFNEKNLIGNVLKKKRTEKGLTQKKVAEITGLSRSYISDVEAARYTPSVRTLTKLCKCLDFDLNFLLLNDVNKDTILNNKETPI